MYQSGALENESLSQLPEGITTAPKGTRPTKRYGEHGIGIRKMGDKTASSNTRPSRMKLYHLERHRMEHREKDPQGLDQGSSQYRHRIQHEQAHIKGWYRCRPQCFSAQQSVRELSRSESQITSMRMQS